jgi:hypothetical protein
MSSASGQLALVRGTVTASKDRMDSIRVDRKTGDGRVSTTPEMWLRDIDGTEHHYSGDMFDAAQPGHEVAVVIKRASGKPVAFANFTGNFVQDAREIRYSTTIGANLTGTFFLTLILAVPGLFAWGALAEPFGLMDAAFSATGFQVYIVVLAACVFAGVKVWSKGYRERTDALKAEIDSLLVAVQSEGM